MEKNSIPVSMPTLWPCTSPICFHKTPKDPHGPFKKDRDNKDSSLFGRQYSNSFGDVDYWKNKGGDSSSTRYSNSFTSVPGICYKSEKVSDDTSSGNRISGNDNLALPQKKIQSIKKMFSDMYQNPQTILWVNKSDWSPDINNFGHSTSKTSMSLFPTATTSGAEEKWLLGNSSVTEQRISIGASLNLNCWMKKIKIYNGRTLIQLLVQAITDRCFTHRLRSSLERSENWRDMDSAGENDVHKQTCVLALKVALETSLKVHKTESLLIQMDNIVDLTYFLKMGDTKKFTNGLFVQTYLGAVITETSSCDSRVPFQWTEQACRHRILLQDRFFRMEASPLIVTNTLCDNGKTILFFQGVSSASNIWSLEEESIQCSNECSLNNLEQKLLCIPSCLPKNGGSEKDRKTRQKKLVCITPCRQIVVAPSNIEHVDKETSNLSIVRKTTNQSFRTDSHDCNKSNPCISSVIGLWGNLFQRGHFVKAANLISNSRGKSSVSGCKLSRKKWSG